MTEMGPRAQNDDANARLESQSPRPERRRGFFSWLRFYPSARKSSAASAASASTYPVTPEMAEANEAARLARQNLMRARARQVQATIVQVEQEMLERRARRGRQGRVWRWFNATYDHPKLVAWAYVFLILAFAVLVCAAVGYKVSRPEERA